MRRGICSGHAPARSRRRCGPTRRDLCGVHRPRQFADHARAPIRGGEHLVLSDDRFVSNLIDMVIGAMTAPVT